MSIQAAQTPRPSDQDLVATYNTNRQTLQSLLQKISELERDAEEHKLVIETLEEAKSKDPQRKCFRMIDSVLVERTVADVLPGLKTTFERLVESTRAMAEAYAQKEAEQNEFIKKYNIQIKA